MAVKKQKSHTSTRKKASISRTTSPRARLTASKASKSARISKAAQKKADEEERRWKKRMELTLKIFRWAYEANQRGEFQRL